ncbi:anti-sigma factor [Jatrophihabitans sp.]|uniref:anti-sigma factor n=1 Tax=Jatrophihabitans sp. TaxID=1932789 RepID=UPI0030C740E3|nr:hypothetical protein [Jatrophihabitans sp.]
MNAHISDELPRLLTGEASRDVVFDAAAHLRECADCQQELVSAVVAHASITSAHRFAPEIVNGGDRAEHAELDEVPALPDMSLVFAQIRQEAAEPAPQVRRIGHVSPRMLLGAAAAVVLIGAGVGTFVAVDSGSSSSGSTVALSAYDVGTAPATAKINGDRVTLDATSLPQVSGKHYEVWLTNATGTQMQSIGWIGNDGKASLTVPKDLVARYSAIQVSVQPATTSAFSDVSVLRGRYSV